MWEASMKRQKPFQLMRGSIIMFQGNAIVPLCDGRKQHLSISSDDAYAGNLTIDYDSRSQALRFHDTLNTVLAAKSPGRNGAVTPWPPCCDLLAQVTRADGTGSSYGDRATLLSPTW